MIGMPRMPFTISADKRCRKLTRQTRISAQTMPSTVDSSSEPTVTMMVSQRPCSRIGRNSRISARNFVMTAADPLLRFNASIETPFREDLLQRAVLGQLVERGVDLSEQLAVALAHADADRAHNGRDIGVDQPHLGKQPLLEVVGQDGLVGEAGLQAAGVDVAED